MSPRDPALAGDFHVHSTYSDDAVSSLGENIAAASAIGLTQLRLVDHVRSSTTWVPEFVRAVAAERVPEGLTIRTGVEAKILDSSGALDIPADLRLGAGGIDAVLIADHQFPGTDGPWSPRTTAAKLEAGLAVGDALDLLVTAIVGAMHSVAAAQLAHCFSILPKIGLAEDDLTDEHLAVWAAEAALTATVVEVNEKWACPGPRALAAARAAGVVLVASTDSHVATDVGRYSTVARLLAVTP
ncbi:histidinol-phosphatase [Glaciihabitans sp. INWT7]|uniref:PHP domain-containing protein n=1 Tax=Glaciihabitans sp. INWT7 TaxID=2596912 RepID=UPI001627FFD1|nr:PHP domain-containing protein [Glaciihabitans sp. INWT7]QNE48358.1 histidinol-phosphatase [Glaciihabitans sp. INWT7]